jgi:hypothetical protein
MPKKRIPPNEPVDGILQITKTHSSVNTWDDATVLRFKCSRCRHTLPDLLRLNEGDTGRLWIEANTEGPWWRWDGNILRPTTTHLKERQRLHEHARRSTDAGFKRLVQESLAHPSPAYATDALRPPQSVERWRHPKHQAILRGDFDPRRPGSVSIGHFYWVDPAPERIECPECRVEVQVPLPTRCDVR